MCCTQYSENHQNNYAGQSFLLCGNFWLLFIPRRREFYSSLNLLLLLRESLLLSRLPETITSSISSSSSTRHVFWKLTFIFPSQTKLNHRDSGIVEWLHHKLQLQPQGREKETSLSPHSLNNVSKPPRMLSLATTQLFSSATSGAVADGGEDRERADRQRKICVAVKALRDETLQRKDEELSRELCGTCAVAVFLPTPQHSNDTAEVYRLKYFFNTILDVYGSQ